MKDKELLKKCWNDAQKAGALSRKSEKYLKSKKFEEWYYENVVSRVESLLYFPDIKDKNLFKKCWNDVQQTDNVSHESKKFEKWHCKIVVPIIEGVDVNLHSHKTKKKISIKKMSSEQIEKLMQKAVGDENYEYAAKLRDELERRKC
jgi:protein-arginine kinase activator protein McsA